MKMRGRILDAALAVLAVSLLALLLYPARPATLPVRPVPAGALQPAQPPASRMGGSSRASPPDVAGLFAFARPVSTPVTPQPAAPPERVAWLHYIAFVVGPSGQTTYFFKNDQTGRVLMLALQEPRDGWALLEMQGDTWMLENGEHRYMVNRK